MREKLKKGEAYRQYIAVITDINVLLEQGYDLKSIHKQLADENKITMTYQAFWHHVSAGTRKVRPVATRRPTNCFPESMFYSEPNHAKVGKQTDLAYQADGITATSHHDTVAKPTNISPGTQEENGETNKLETKPLASMPIADDEQDMDERRRQFDILLKKKVEEAQRRSLISPSNDDPEIRALKEKLF